MLGYLSSDRGIPLPIILDCCLIPFEQTGVSIRSSPYVGIPRVSNRSFPYDVNPTDLFESLVTFLPSLSSIPWINLMCRIIFPRQLVLWEQILHEHMSTYTVQHLKNEWMCMPDVFTRYCYGLIHFMLGGCVGVVFGWFRSSMNSDGV